jgi:sulfate/thiosulfate transport system substrate-binding protein
MRPLPWLNIAALAGVVIGLSLVVIKNAPSAVPHLLNVSYDPTRELYQALNLQFAQSRAESGSQPIQIAQSHGGSSRQARKVISGELDADVVTLGLSSDIEALRKRGLVAADWASRLPNHAVPYTSTIVFVVRQGNPLGIRDWPDLLAPGLEIVTPNPRTSGNGKLTVLAAWAAIVSRGGSEADARAYLAKLYQHVPVLDEGARDAAIRFAVQEIGDVHLTWENEALREVAESSGRLQIVDPPVSILAEPAVAWVDTAVARHGSLDVARAYLGFLFSDTAQQTIARLGYRPFKPEQAAKTGVSFAPVQLVPITAISHGWDDAAQTFFADNGIIDAILGSRAP